MNIYNTIKYLIKKCSLAGFKADAQQLTKETNVLKNQIVKVLFDKKDKMFLDGLDNKGKPVRHYSVHDQVLAMMNDLVKI